MNIAIDEHFDQFIREQVSSGRFQSAEEVVTESLRVFEDRQSKIQALRAHLEAARAEEGGFFDEELDEILSRGELPD